MGSKARKSTRRRSTRKSLKTQEDLMDFETFFWFKTRDGVVRDTQKKEIRVFFTEKGLGTKETQSKFEEILKLY